MSLDRFIQPADGIEITKGDARAAVVYDCPVLPIRYTLAASVASVKPRAQKENGRDYLIVPVVALTEGVIHALGAPHAEFVPGSVYSDRFERWNEQPLYYGHPMRNGEPISGSAPDVRENLSFGFTRQSVLKDGRLMMEAWVDAERAGRLAPDLIARLEAADGIEVSIGAYVEVEPHNERVHAASGRKYRGTWARLTPDHLALLPRGHVGACSIMMGCGVRAAKAKGEKDMSLLNRIVEKLREAAKSGSELGTREIEDRLRKALQAKEGGMCYILDFYPEAGTVVYDVDYSSPSPLGIAPAAPRPLRQRTFEVSDDGAVTVGDTSTEVEFVGRYEPLEQASEAGAAAPCGCKDKEQPKGAVHMRDAVKNLLQKLGAGFTEENAKFLEGATDEQIAALETAVTPKEVVTEKTVEVIKEVPATPKTLAEAVALVPEDQRTSYNAFVAAQESHRQATIKALKDSGKSTFSDEQLAAKPQSELDQLVALTGGKVINFAGQAPRAAEEAPKGAPEAPNTVEAIRAARQKK